MNKEKDEDLDKIFRKGLEDPVNEAAYREADWDAMEQMLDQRKKRSAIIRLLPVLGSVAALILIFLGYLFLKPNATKPTKNEQMSAVHRSDTSSIANTDGQLKNNTGTSGEPTRKAAADSSKQPTNAAQYVVSPPAHKARGENGKSFFSLSSGKARRHATGTDSGYINDNNDAQKQELIAGQNTEKQSNQTGINDRIGVGHSDDKGEINKSDADKQKTAADANALAVDNKPKVVTPANDNAAVEKADVSQKGVIAANANNKADDTSRKLKVKGLSRRSINRPVFALGILASSDLNGVNSAFQQSKIGGNFGAVLSVTFAKKWTISTGATYDIKPYLTNFTNYHTAYKFPENPQSVNADCRMLDIPVNINYQVYSQRGNKITLGTGLSSYFMLREDYKFNYADPYETGPTNYTVINKNRNILSVLNIDATYTHQINSKMGITVQPYTKVPLSDVGASAVRLQSTGVALGVNWNISASSKPK